MNIEDTGIDKVGLSFNDNNTRGHIFRIQKSRCIKTSRQQTFPIRCINDWNTLSDETEECDIYFKTKLDKHWSGKRFELDQVY